jgi:hypothetical protein
MANIGYLISLLNPLPADVKRTMTAYTNEGFKRLAFGGSGSSLVAATNFDGHLVPVTTNAVANAEVAVAHGLARVPRLIIPALDPSAENATIPVFTISRAADATYLYIESATQNASFHLYCE